MEVSDLIPVAAVVASVIAASAVARYQISKLELNTDKLGDRLDQQDVRLDKLITSTEVLDRRTTVLSEILSPSNLEIRTRQLETIRTDIEWIKRKLESK
jgi:phosphoribosylaminoimidazole-succinocarboxamide synthase